MTRSRYDGPAREIRALDTYVKLMRASNAVQARLEPRFRAIGLTERQFGVLEALLHLGPLQQHEIGKKVLVSRANITLIVDQLSDRGLVRRERQRDDRRCVRVHLTAEGRRQIGALFPSHAAVIADVLSPLSASEQRRLGRLCRKLGLSLTGVGR
jgi:MarR family 2-MHQ and catechol resistance regulon transcriptional repressor